LDRLQLRFVDRYHILVGHGIGQSPERNEIRNFLPDVHAGHATRSSESALVQSATKGRRVLREPVRGALDRDIRVRGQGGVGARRLRRALVDLAAGEGEREVQ
jgi:hypothetical protein